MIFPIHREEINMELSNIEEVDSDLIWLYLLGSDIWITYILYIYSYSIKILDPI